MKKKLALFLAVVLAVSTWGGYIPANAADGRIVMEPSELKGNTQTAVNVEETTYDGVDVLKMTPDGANETDSVLLDNWDILDLTVSEADYPYVAVDYYFEAEEGGSLTGWNINGSVEMPDKETYEAVSETHGPAVTEYDAESTGHDYIVKMDASVSSYLYINQVINATAGETYIFSCNYYKATSSYNAGIRFYNSAGKVPIWANTYNKSGVGKDADNNPVVGGALSTLNDADGNWGTLAVEYTVQAGETWIRPAFCVENGEVYLWNFSVTRIPMQPKGSGEGCNSKNYLNNADFTKESGSWIGWRFGTSTTTAVADKTESDAKSTEKGTYIIPYDETIVEKVESEYMLALDGNYQNSAGTTYTGDRNVRQRISGVSEGETYIFACDYYIPAGARGGIRFFAENVNDGTTAMWTARGWLTGVTAAERGTMVIEYTIPEKCTWLDAALLQEANAQYGDDYGYYWNLRVVKKGGDGTNLLTNADFAIDDNKVPEYMGMRMLPPLNTDEYRSSENKVVTNQWARAIFDYSDWYDTYGELTDGKYDQMHFYPWGRSADSKGTTAEGTMYINNISFYKEKPGTISVEDLSFISEQVQVVRGGSVRIPTVNATGENYPVAAHDLTLSEHTSETTYLSDGYLYVGADETAEKITLTATSVLNSEVTATCAVYVNDVKVEYRYVEDIAQYRSGEKSYPNLEGYIFAGWYQGTADVVPTTDETLTPVATTTTDGGAWAKYVPEETLVVKAQTTDSIADNPANTKLRLVSTVDSLRYSEVGFKIKYNQGSTEYTHDTDTVYEEIVAIDTDDKAINYVPSLFVATSKYFVAYTILDIGADLFNNYEFAVTPYWITLDGTTVRGVTRERLLVTDELATDADGCDFTVKDSTYTYTTTKSEGSTASYQYIQGASDSVYMEGTYTKSDSQFGLSIRNGGQERQIFFDTDGVKVVNSDMTVSGLVEGKEVTIHNAAAINAMLSADAGTETKVVWEINNNVLYCSLGGVAVYEVSMKDLCAEWLPGRYYQVGLAGYNEAVTETAAVFVLGKLQFGK